MACLLCTQRPKRFPKRTHVSSGRSSYTRALSPHAQEGLGPQRSSRGPSLYPTPPHSTPAPPGRGAGGRAGRLFRALAQCPSPARQAARGRRRSQKEGLCRRPALGPAARRQGLGGGRRRRSRRQRGPPHPSCPGGRRHRAWRATEGGWHRRALEGVDGRRWGLPSAQTARPGRTRGSAGEGRGPQCGETRRTGPLPFAHLGISPSRAPASVSNYPI